MDLILMSSNKNTTKKKEGIRITPLEKLYDWELLEILYKENEKLVFFNKTASNITKFRFS